MVSNIVLQVKDLAFNLPDDFKGDVYDALKLLIEYHDTEKAKKNHFEGDFIPVGGEIPDAMDTLWNNENLKSSMCGSIGVFIDDKWVAKSRIE